MVMTYQKGWQQPAWNPLALKVLVVAICPKCKEDMALHRHVGVTTVKCGSCGHTEQFPNQTMDEIANRVIAECGKPIKP